MTNFTLTIGWLYPDLMSTYGDRGNIIVLQKRCAWRGINTTIIPIQHDTSLKDIKNVDLIFGGGSQDREQEIVMKDLRGKKGHIIKDLIDQHIPALFVCGAPQLMGKYYEPAEGKQIEGLGIFDMISVHPGNHTQRLIGNTIAEVQWQNFLIQDTSQFAHNKLIVGFENHGGRTYLGNNAKPFAKVVKGYGNNGEDGNEGVIYNNAIGCYFHGPLLPKNPHIADFLLETALYKKYKKTIKLQALDNTLELKAQSAIVKKLTNTV